MSLKLTILNYLQAQYPRIVHKGEIGRKAVLEWGYENENMGRRCRELENEGKIRRIMTKKNKAQYQFISHSQPTEFYKRFEAEFRPKEKKKENVLF